MEIQPDGTLAAETESLLREILRSVFGAEARLASYQVSNSRRDYVVLSARLLRPALRIIVKLAGPDAPLACPFDRTAALHRLVRAHTSVPLPEVLAADASYRIWPVRYMIKAYAPGFEWASVRSRMDAQQLDDAYRQIGRAVAELHSLHFPAFGELCVSPDATIQGGASLVEALAERADRRIANPAHAELFVALLNGRSGLFAGVTQASVCHEDLHGHNILFRRERGRWRLSAILDFDSAWAGHSESDLARLELWQGMTGAGFWETYLAARPLAELYPQRRPIYQLLWCLEYGSVSPRHLADTQQVCRELGIQSL